MALFGLGPTEILLIVLIIVLLFFGPKKLPQLVRAVGESFGEFKKGLDSNKGKKAKKKKSKK